jgi:hypothetical protein
MPARPENQPRPVRPIDKFDPGWLFLVGGLVLLGFTVVIPAQTDLAEAQWQRDRALAIEAQRKERLFKHERYLAAPGEPRADRGQGPGGQPAQPDPCGDGGDRRG